MTRTMIARWCGLAAAASVLAACARPVVVDPFATPYLTTGSRVAQEASHRDVGPDWFDLGPGQTLELGNLDGPGIIRRFWIAVGTATEPQFTRKLVLRAWWDGAGEPSVEVPLGDFFGSGFGINPHVASAFFTQSTGGFTSLWPMPFRRSARVTLTNESATTLAIYYQLTWTRERALPRDAHYFHAQWKQARPAPEGENLVLLDTRGRGRLAGLNLAIQGAYREREHYLEGDELVFIDGAEEPTLAGTGHEDLFNNAWYFNGGIHARPTHGVVVMDPSRSRYAAYRLFLHENVEFRRALRFELEHAEAYNSEKADYWATMFWYQSPPRGPAAPLPHVSQRLPAEPRPLYREPGVVEAEGLVPGFLYRMSTYREEVSQFRAVLLTNDHLEADRGLTFTLDAPTTTTMQLGLRALQHASGGTWALVLNGERLGAPLDTWDAAELTTSLTGTNRAIPPVDLGEHPVRAGRNTLRLLQTDINARAVDRVFTDGGDKPLRIPRGALLLDAIVWNPTSTMQVLEAETMTTDPPGIPKPTDHAREGSALWCRFAPELDVAVPFRVDKAGTYRLTAWFAGASRPTTLDWRIDGGPEGDAPLHIPLITAPDPNTAHDLGTFELGRGEFSLVLSAPGLRGNQHAEVALDAVVLDRLDENTK